jgi:hypothetical protein
MFPPEHSRRVEAVSKKDEPGLLCCRSRLPFQPTAYDFDEGPFDCVAGMSERSRCRSVNTVSPAASSITEPGSGVTRATLSRPVILLVALVAFRNSMVVGSPVPINSTEYDYQFIKKRVPESVLISLLKELEKIP